MDRARVQPGLERTATTREGVSMTVGAQTDSDFAFAGLDTPDAGRLWIGGAEVVPCVAEAALFLRKAKRCRLT